MQISHTHVHSKPYGCGNIFTASNYFAQGMAAVYRGTLEASVPGMEFEEERTYTILDPKIWPDDSKGETKDGKEKKVSFNKLDI